MSKVAFIKSDDRRYNIERSLSLIKSEIIAGLKDAKRIVVKPNCVSDNVQLAATNAEALDTILGFIYPYVEHQIILAEGTAIGSTFNAFKNFGYLPLQQKYGFAIVDLNTDDFKTIELLDRRGSPWQAQFSKTLLEADYLISVSPPKTHDSVVYTGAVNNVSVGGLLRPPTDLATRLTTRFKKIINSKTMIHQGPAIINENIKRIYQHVPLKLAVLDAFEAMEGNGPINGDMVPAHFAIASSDPLAADWLACQLMGIDINDVGYLSLLNASNEDVFFVGNGWTGHTMNFKMHQNFESIRKWH